MPCTVAGIAPVPMFQSAPGREAERCAEIVGHVPVDFSFNPRPAVRPSDATDLWDVTRQAEPFQSAPGREAERCIVGRRMVSERSLFQSAPGREAERCSMRLTPRTPAPRFQSAPGREAERCLAAGGRSMDEGEVSIRARP